MCVPAAWVKVPVPSGVPVPPVDEMVTVEEPPWQTIAVWLSDAESAVGWVKVTETDEVQPFASVTVYEVVPAVWLKVPVPVYVPVPPVAETTTEADPPLHRIAP